MLKLQAITFQLIVSVFISTVVFGRVPLLIEQNQCRIVFADKLTVDNGIQWIEAYENVNGSVCETFCRISKIENIMNFEPIISPDFILCGFGPRYCYKGICRTALDISRIIRGHKISPIIDDTDDSVNDEVTWDISTNTNISLVPELIPEPEDVSTEQN